MTAALTADAVAPLAGKTADAAPGLIVLSVPGMRCAGCIRAIEAALDAMPGTHDARANLTMKRVTVKSDLPASNLVDCLSGIGFEAYPFDAGQTAQVQDTKGRDLLLRIGIAGFAMMNVMLLSVAVWSGASDATRDLFHLISAAIALPACLYAAEPFLKKAWDALRVFRVNMDVPISLAIVLAAGMSLFEALNGGEHAYFDAALSLTFFLLIGRYLEHRTRAAARSAALDLCALQEPYAQRKCGRSYQTIPAKEVAKGDVLLVATGKHVPADGCLLGRDALTDRAFLTGESEPMFSRIGAQLFAGEINVGNPFHIRATDVGEDTSLYQMARLVETAETARTRYTSLADRAARIYAPAVHLLAAISFAGWLLATGDMRHALNVAVAVLIITCPCALGLAVPAVATAAIGRLYELGFLVKSGTALERFAEIDTVVFDKTGTLTSPGVTIDDMLDDGSKGIALALAQTSQHPVAAAVVSALSGVTPAKIRDVCEVPGMGITAMAGHQLVALGKSEWLGGTGPDLCLKIGEKLAVLAKSDAPRKGAHDCIAELGRQGLDISILSGDNREKTGTLARELCVHEWAGEMSPQAKHDQIRSLQREGRKVAMIGDGINDTAALSAAHASLAPGSALNAARNAADVVILRDGLQHVPTLIRTARKSVKLSRQNFAIALIYNAIAVPVAIAGMATPLIAALAMSASSITVLINAMRVRRNG